MFKKIIIGTLATFVIGAASVSAYNAVSETTVVSAEENQSESFIAGLVDDIVQSQTAEQIKEVFQLGDPSQTQAQNYGQVNNQTGAGQGQGQQGAGGSGYRGGRNEEWTTGSGNNAATLVNIHGTLTDVGLATVTFTSDDGQVVTVNVDPAALGLTLNVGDDVTISGNWLDEATFTPMHITLDTTGETFSLNMGAGSGGQPRGQGANGGGNNE